MTSAECAAQPPTTLEVLRTGPLALIRSRQTRPGTWGLPPARLTADPTLANRLPPTPATATIEVTFGGFSARGCVARCRDRGAGADTDRRERKAVRHQ
jgi:hypothetical protein